MFRAGSCILIYTCIRKAFYNNTHDMHLKYMECMLYIGMNVVLILSDVRPPYNIILYCVNSETSLFILKKSIRKFLVHGIS